MLCASCNAARRVRNAISFHNEYNLCAVKQKHSLTYLAKSETNWSCKIVMYLHLIYTTYKYYACYINIRTNYIITHVYLYPLLKWAWSAFVVLILQQGSHLVRYILEGMSHDCDDQTPKTQPGVNIIL